MTLPLSRRRDQDEGSVDLSPPRTWETGLKDVKCRFGHSMRYTLRFNILDSLDAPECHVFAPCRTCGKEDLDRTTYQFGVVIRRRVHWYAFPDHGTWDKVLDIIDAATKQGGSLSADKVVALIGQAWNKPNDLG